MSRRRLALLLVLAVLLAAGALSTLAYRGSRARLAPDRALLDEYEARFASARDLWAEVHYHHERLRIAAGLQ